MNSITAAKNRRVNPPSSATPQNTYVNKSPQATAATSPNTSNTALTLPQVIQLVDIRLTNLEKTVVEIKSNSKNVTFAKTENETAGSHPQYQSRRSDDEIDAKLRETVEEFDKRYEMLAQEVIEIKNIVMRLQTYTMDVNKMLMEERSQIIDELERKEQENREEPSQEAENF